MADPVIALDPPRRWRHHRELIRQRGEGEAGEEKVAASEGAEPREAPGFADGALVKRAAAGDAAAYRVLVARHLATVLATAGRILTDRTEAEDVAQEAMLRLWQSAGRLEIGEAGVGPWLRRVAANLAIDRVRRRRETTVAEVPEVAEPPTQLQGLAENDLSRRVAAALAALPERQRLAVTLFHYGELSQSEVAAKLAITEEALESLLARGRRALRAALKDDWRALLPDAEGK